MSRVNDDNSDNRRIREMNETAHDRKLRNEKKGLEARSEQTFREVMQSKAQKDGAQKKATEKNAERTNKEEQSVLDRIRKRAPKSGVERDRRAALQQQLKGGLLKKNALKAGENARAEAARAEELTNKSELELEHVDKEARREDEHEVVRSDEKQADVVKEQNFGAPTERADPDGRQRQNQNQGRGGNERNQNEATAVENTRHATRSAIPQEVLQRLVSAIYKAVSADGRTSMQITLKGGKLEGVTVKIDTTGGKVSCEFGNCPKDVKTMLERGKSALAKGLSRRGLKLDRLSVS